MGKFYLSIYLLKIILFYNLFLKKYSEKFITIINKMFNLKKKYSKSFFKKEKSGIY
jgi:hypothetical protein